MQKGGNKVFVSRSLPGHALRPLEDACEVRLNTEDRAVTRKELLEGVKGCEGILCLLSERIDREVMNAAGDMLRVISNYAVGYNNIDVDEATRRGILVCNTPGVLTEATADLAWALLLAAARRIVEADRMVRQGGFKGWAPEMLLGIEISGKTMGIAGMGRIGSAVARRAAGFGLKIIYADENRNEIMEKKLGARMVDKNTLLKESDFISLHLPLTDDTRHYISERDFDMMKPDAVLVNASRGPVVDEKALIKALSERRIAAAGLDVYEREPEVEPGLAQLDNVILAPHLGSATLETRTKMAEMAVRSLLDALQGKIPEHCVNPQAFKQRKNQ
jgi:glyoxylate reductase